METKTFCKHNGHPDTCPACNSREVNESDQTSGCALNTYKVTRFVKVEYEVKAFNRKQALENAENPYSEIITKETCVETK